jgi:type I restriction enzyme S subunit
MRTQWPIAQLSEVCHFQNGYPFKNSDYVEEGDGAFEIFRMGNIRKGGGFNPDGKKALVAAEQAATLRRFLLNKGDILMCMTDMKANVALLGHTARMPVSGRYLVNQRVGRITVRKPEALDQHFLYYYSNSPAYIGWLRSHANSGVQVNLSTEAILNSPIACPPLPIQRRIASILSAYDDLIENNQRRIKILEMMARALYREWFVHFRFPGHENHPRVASPLGEIPEGWEVRPFAALATYVNGYPFKPAQLGADGIPVIKIKELKGGIVADTPRNSGQDIPEKYHIRDGDVLFSWSADLNVYLWAGGAGLLNQHLFTVMPANNISLVFCFHSLKEAMPRFRSLSLGATMHHIKRSALDQVSTVVAPALIRQQFDALAEPMHSKVLTLTRHVANLHRTRDLLLPRLLSGQIDVEQLQEPALQEVS